jgi:hypothetical protein
MSNRELKGTVLGTGASAGIAPSMPAVSGGVARTSFWWERWSGSTGANWLRFLPSKMKTNGAIGKPHAAPCHNGSAIPCPRPDTGLA